MPKIKIKCTCGKMFERYIYPDANPFDFMCPECAKNDWWHFATRLLKTEKFKCVRCGWKLGKDDSTNLDENVLWFKCKCCGYKFGLFFNSPY